MHFRQTSGSWLGASALLLTLLAAGCNYGFRGGGGLPEHIRTIYVAALQLDTRAETGANIPPQLDSELYRALTEKLPGGLGLRPAGERNADLLVRCTVTRYDDVASNYRPGEQGNVDVEQHQVSITVSVQLIDVRDNLIRYESTSVMGQGQYRPGSESDTEARKTAILQIIQKILDGAQSQW